MQNLAPRNALSIEKCQDKGCELYGLLTETHSREKKEIFNV